MRLLIALIAILWMPLAAADPDADCKGDPHHCIPGGGNGQGPPGPPGGGDATANSGAVAGAISGSTSGAVAEGGAATAGVGDTTATSNTDVVNNLSIFGGGGGEGGAGGVDGQSTNGTGGGGPILSPSTSVVTTTTNKYKEAPRAYAGLASFPKDIDCRIVLGFDFRGATEDGSGGATFGIPMPERKDCKFERQAARAFAKGDLERGWANHCRSPTNIESTIWVARAVQGEDIDVDGAFRRCMRNATVEDPEPPKT